VVPESSSSLEARLDFDWSPTVLQRVTLVGAITDEEGKPLHEKRWGSSIQQGEAVSSKKAELARSARRAKEPSCLADPLVELIAVVSTGLLFFDSSRN